MLIIRFFLKFLPLVCRRFLVLLFFRIKPLLSLVVSFFLLISYEIPLITSSVQMIRQFLCLDLEKAIDRVNCNFLLDLLIAVDFGPDFCRWIEEQGPNITGPKSGSCGSGRGNFVTRSLMHYLGSTYDDSGRCFWSS